MSGRPRLALRSAVLPVALGLALTGCTTTASGSGDGSGDGGSSTGGSGLNCDGVASAGWELMADPRVTVDPSDDVVPLTTAGESLTVTDDEPGESTTYSYQLGYLQENGTVAPNRSGALIDAEETHVIVFDGPFAPMGVSGGPYAGILQIDANDGGGIVTLARVCVALATSD